MKLGWHYAKYGNLSAEVHVPAIEGSTNGGAPEIAPPQPDDGSK
jgi:hypothetical protein